MREIIRYSAPAAWASYLINGDASGIDDKDASDADAFVADVGCGAPVSCSDESFFTWRPDYGMAGDCLEYAFFSE